jgi:hypothetical protein
MRYALSSSFYELSPATHSFLLLTDNVQGLNEAVHVVTTRFQHLHWPQLGCFILGNYLIIVSFTQTLATCRSYDGTWFASDVTTCALVDTVELHESMKSGLKKIAYSS